jgi:uncharacterized membrane protein
MSNTGHTAPDIAKIVERNVNTLLHRKKQDQKKRSLPDKIAQAIASFAGTMLSVSLHVILFGTWIAWNLGLLGLKPFDPSFIIMATFAAVEAIFLTSFVLIGQKQMNVEFDKRAELDLQVGLLSEHEITRVLTLVTAIAKTMNIEIAEDKEMKNCQRIFIR